MNKRLDLGKKAILPLILKMSWPSIIAMTAMSLPQFHRHLLACPFQLSGTCRTDRVLSHSTACRRDRRRNRHRAGSFSARMFGAEKNLEAQKTAGRDIFSFHAVRLRKHSFVLLFGDSMLVFFGASDEILPLSHDYLFLAVYSSPFLFFSMMTYIMLRVEGRPLLSMNVVLIALISSAILDPFLIFGIGPFPRMGIRALRWPVSSRT